MDASSTHHHQLEMSSQTLESMLVCTNPQEEKKATRPAEQGMKCPRCDSTNTKFCYYNNYSLTQPRYFCKSCRRYWTKGGTLRNVPVGGGCRKNKRSSSKRTQENPTFLTTTTNNDNNSSNSILSSLAPSLSYDYSTDLSVAFAMLQQKQHNNAHQMGFEDYEFPIMAYNNNNNLSSVNNGYENNFYNHGQTSHFDNGGSLGTINNGGEAVVKQEGEQNSNRILWGFPWHINGGDANIMAATNGYGSTWQGLINSPLI